MPKVNMNTNLAVSAERLWEMIGGFNALADWHPAIEKSELEQDGTIRRLSLMGGGSIVEQLEKMDDDGRVYRYSILESPLPVANYTAEIKVRDNEDGTSTVEWSSEFNPKDASEVDATKAIQDIYEAGFENLKKMFGV